MNPLICTVCYPLVKIPDGGDGYIHSIVLGRKKDTPGARKLKMVDKWNGPGGKLDPAIDKSIAECAQRETEDDFGIKPALDRIVEAGVVTFDNAGVLVEVHFSFVDEWTGEFVKESREMRDIRPFDIRELPYGEMMDSDRRFKLPRALLDAVLMDKVLYTTMVHDADMRVVSHEPFEYRPRS